MPVRRTTHDNIIVILDYLRDQQAQRITVEAIYLLMMDKTTSASLSTAYNVLKVLKLHEVATMQGNEGIGQYTIDWDAYDKFKKLINKKKVAKT